MGEGWWGDSQGVWDGHVHTAMFKMDNQQGPTVQHMELCSMLCGSLDGRGVWGRMDTCVCMTESLCCSPETYNIESAAPQYEISFKKCCHKTVMTLNATDRARLTCPAAAKSLQSCLTLCNPIDGSPPGSPVPGILQARTLEWVAISFSSA